MKQEKQEHAAQCALIQEFIREAHARRDIRLADRAAVLASRLDQRDAPHESYETDAPFGRVRIEARQVDCTHNDGEVHHDVTRWFVKLPGPIDAEYPEYFESAEDAAAWCMR